MTSDKFKWFLNGLCFGGGLLTLILVAAITFIIALWVVSKAG